MGANTRIEWTDATWNPVRGCTRVSEGCRHCYAERMAVRMSGPGGAYEGLVGTYKDGVGWTGQVRLVPEVLSQPFHWRKPRMVFVCSMSDLFHERVAEKYIAKVFAVMALTPHHTYQILTKRPDRMARLLADEDFQFHVGWFASAAVEYYGIKRPGELPPWPYRHVWIGVSAEDQRRANERIPLLLETPAAVRFVSAEPLLGPIRLDCISRRVPHDDWTYYDDALTGFRATKAGGWYDTKLDWVIAGGESGPGARPMHPDWARSLRDQCVEAGVPFFFKQHGEWREACPPNEPIWGGKPPELLAAHGTYFARLGKRAAGRLLDGRTWDEMPRAEVTA